MNGGFQPPHNSNRTNRWLFSHRRTFFANRAGIFEPFRSLAFSRAGSAMGSMLGVYPLRDAFERQSLSSRTLLRDV
jgi:hypothetical protein